MPYRNTQAIVLSRSDWRENDRILTLFSPEFGRVDALCRGCRKPKSPLLAASELMTLSEVTLFSGKGREVLQSAQVVEHFYPLRLDYERLEYAAVMARACLKAIQPEQGNSHLFILLLRSLKRLAYEEARPPEQTAAAFLLHFVSILGYRPQFTACVRCGQIITQTGGYLLPQEGGVCCRACSGEGERRHFLNNDALSWLSRVLTAGIDQVDQEDAPAPLPYLPMKAYAEAVLETRLPRVSRSI